MASLIFREGQKVLTALINPMVPIEIRSSIPHSGIFEFPRDIDD